ncbi:MAG: helix-turn-helix domain-containing protein [Sedimenticola sp.]
MTDYQKLYGERNEAMARAYLSGVYTMAEIGAHFGIHYMTVSRAVRQFEIENG